MGLRTLSDRSTWLASLGADGAQCLDEARLRHRVAIEAGETLEVRAGLQLAPNGATTATAPPG